MIYNTILHDITVYDVELNYYYTIT